MFLSIHVEAVARLFKWERVDHEFKNFEAAREEARWRNLSEGRVQTLSDEVDEPVRTAVNQNLVQDSIVEIDKNSSVSVDGSTRSATKHMENIEWLLLYTSLILEGTSAIFEQLGYDFSGMVMAIVGLMLCMVELSYKARKEQASIEWRTGSLPRIYSQYPRHKLFGTTMEYFGLADALWQLLHSTVGYIYARQKSRNRIRMTIAMFLFCLLQLLGKLVTKCSRLGHRRESNP